MSGSPKRAWPGMTVWAKLGAELALTRPEPRSPAGRLRPLQTTRLGRKWGALAFLPVAAAIPVILFRFHVTDHLATRMGVVGGFVVVWLVVFLLLISINQLLLFRLDFATLLRAGVFLFLCVAGLAAQSGIAFVGAVSEAQLSGPELQPLLVGKGRKPLAEANIRSIQERLEAKRLVPPAASVAERAVFGRHAHAQIGAFIPAEAAERSVPDCSSAQSLNSRAFAMMAVAPDESFLKQLDWVPMPPEAGSLAALRIGGSTATPPPPLLAEDAGHGSLYVEKSLFGEDGGFGLGPTAALPRWLCVELLKDATYAPYAIAAIIENIPSYDLYDFRLVMHIDAGATVAAGQVTTQGDEPSYSLMSVWIEPATRPEMLAFLRGLAGAKEVRTEVGFARLEGAIEAARTASNLATGFAAIVASLAVAVTAVFVLQAVDHSRREIAVARAFGANAAQIICFVLALLFVPLAIAIFAGLVTVLYPFGWLLGGLADTFGFARTVVPPAHVLFAQVVAFGALLAIGVIITTVVLHLWTRGSIAQQLQETG